MGWHKFTIERMGDGSTINFFVDDILSRTITGATIQSWDTLIFSYGFRARLVTLGLMAW